MYVGWQIYLQCRIYKEQNKYSNDFENGKF